MPQAVRQRSVRSGRKPAGRSAAKGGLSARLPRSAKRKQNSSNVARVAEALARRTKSQSKKGPAAVALAALGAAGVALSKRRKSMAANEPVGAPSGAEPTQTQPNEPAFETGQDALDPGKAQA